MTAIQIQYGHEMPKHKRPIVSIGAGGIMKDAHLPAYQKAGFEVAGITDLNTQKARDLANTFNIPNVYTWRLASQGVVPCRASTRRSACRSPKTPSRARGMSSPAWQSTVQSHCRAVVFSSATHDWSLRKRANKHLKYYLFLCKTT